MRRVADVDDARKGVMVAHREDVHVDGGDAQLVGDQLPQQVVLALPVVGRTPAHLRPLDELVGGDTWRRATETRPLYVDGWHFRTTDQFGGFKFRWFYVGLTWLPDAKSRCKIP